MKKIVYTLIFTVIFVLYPVRSSAIQPALPARVVPEKIINFNTLVKIQPTGIVRVTETIHYNFGDNTKHGLRRVIPVGYTGPLDTNYRVRLKVVGVTDEAGKPYTYTTNRKDDSVEIKIGDKDVWVTGEKIYVLNYQVERTISFLEDYDEWYWNILGEDWEVPIDRAMATILLPEGVVEKQVMSTCYTGLVGSTEHECATRTTTIGGLIAVEVTGKTNFLPGHALTVVVGFPKNIIAAPSELQQAGWFLADNWPLTMPFIVFAIMFALWWHKGREPKGRGVVVAQYEPPHKLSPIEIGTIVNQRIDKRDVSSIIIDLAVRGFINIRYISEKFTKDYEFIKKGDAKNLSLSFEKLCFKDMFGNATTKKLSSLRNKFYETTKEIKSDVYKTLTTKGYFEKNPYTIRIIYFIIGIAFGFVGVPLSGDNPNSAFFNLLAFWVAGIIVILFSFAMPRYTALGAQVKEEIEGFKLFLSVTEKERLKFHNAPAKKPELFEKYLPYAMALKVEKEWAEQFKDIYTEPPSWYQGNWSHFNTVAFTSSLNSFSSSAGSAFVSSPSSGGSGFGGGSSGGGFGGGGGGSW